MNIFDKDNETGIVTNAITASAGGALIGSFFGFVGSIIGALIAAGVVGYCSYKQHQH